MSSTVARSYRVEAVRSGDWWAITVPELSGGVFTQARRLDQVEATVREAIAMMLDIEEGDIGTIEVDVTPPAKVSVLLNAFETRMAAANKATEAAATTRREAARALRDEGLPFRDIGRLLGVSHQRISQILSGWAADLSDG